MRNLIFGSIGTLWGGAIVLSSFFRSAQSTSGGSYQAGLSAGIVFAGLMFIVGSFTAYRAVVQLSKQRRVSSTRPTQWPPFDTTVRRRHR